MTMTIPPFIKAAESGELSVVEFLVDNGANVNAPNSNDCKNEYDTGVTPLYIAAFIRYLDIVRFLILFLQEVEATQAIR